MGSVGEPFDDLAQLIAAEAVEKEVCHQKVVFGVVGFPFQDICVYERYVLNPCTCSLQLRASNFQHAAARIHAGDLCLWQTSPALDEKAPMSFSQDQHIAGVGYPI